MMEFRDRLRGAFRDLRQQGFAARMNFSCCGSCGHYAMTQAGHKRYVFYHNQEHENVFGFDGKKLHLQWEGSLTDARRMIDVFNRRGLTVDWNGSHNQCLIVRVSE